MPQLLCGGQKTSCTYFFPSTFIWVLGFELRLLGLQGKQVFYFMCVCMFLNVCLCTTCVGACGSQKRALDSLEFPGVTDSL